MKKIALQFVIFYGCPHVLDISIAWLYFTTNLNVDQEAYLPKFSVSWFCSESNESLVKPQLQLFQLNLSAYLFA